MRHSLVPEELEKYCEKVSSPESVLRTAVREYTLSELSQPQMMSTPLQGALLQFLCRSISCKRALELGTFSGYATLAIAEALESDGQIVTCEVDPQRRAEANRFFDRSEHRDKILSLEGDALALMKDLSPPFCLVFIDADKARTPSYVDASVKLLRPGGLLIVDNALWSGAVLAPTRESDNGLAAANQMLAVNQRLQNVLLPVRDGLHLALKIKD